MELSSVLAAVDVNDRLGPAVLRAASEIAERFGAGLHVVSAWPRLRASAPVPAVMPGFAMEPHGPSMRVSEAAWEENTFGRKRHADAIAALVRRHAPGASIDILDGDPGDVVPEIAARVDADLIVAGSHQRGFWGRLTAGAHSRDILRDAPCAVFLVTPGAAERLFGRRYLQ